MNSLRRRGASIRWRAAARRPRPFDPRPQGAGRMAPPALNWFGRDSRRRSQAPQQVGCEFRQGIVARAHDDDAVAGSSQGDELIAARFAIVKRERFADSTGAINQLRA